MKIRKFVLITAILAVATVGAVTALKLYDGGNERNISYAVRSEEHIGPLSRIDNEQALTALSDAGAESAQIRSMAATHTPTPTPTAIPELIRMTAVYKGKEVVVGEEVDRQDFEVRGVYSNGSVLTRETINKFEILDPIIYEVGDNDIVLYYEGIETTVKVKGKEPLKIVKITATYKGGSVIITNNINKNDVEVYAYYNWPEKSKDKITNFTLEPSTVENVGRNVISVGYGDVEPVTINVTGLEKTITKVDVKYLGGPVYVGEYVTEEDFEVLVTYNDGSETTVDNFKLTGDCISAQGINYVVVSYRDHITRVEVQGVAKATAIWDEFPESYWGGNTSTSVTMLVSREKRAQTIEVTYVDWQEIDECVKRVFFTNNYFGFDVTYTDPDAILEFPLPCRVRRPDDFEPDNFAIFYSPNKKTIMARVNGEYQDSGKNFFVFEMEQPGTYIMVDLAEGQYVSSINVKETNIKLRINRNYSLDPVVLPTTAGNREVSYYSTDDWVATVSDTGKIKTVGAGECDIYIQAVDGSGVYEVVHVTVTDK